MKIKLAFDVGMGDQPPNITGIRSDNRKTGRNVMFEQALKGPQQYGQTLPLFGAPDKKDPEMIGFGLRPGGCGLSINSVRDDGEVAAVPASAGPGGCFRDCDSC